MRAKALRADVRGVPGGGLVLCSNKQMTKACEQHKSSGHATHAPKNGAYHLSDRVVEQLLVQFFHSMDNVWIIWRTMLWTISRNMFGPCCGPFCGPISETFFWNKGLEQKFGTMFFGQFFVVVVYVY